jgi:hypothetical protein
MKASVLTPKLLRLTDACWRAVNYLSVRQIYLCNNLRMPALEVRRINGSKNGKAIKLKQVKAVPRKRPGKQ